MFRFIPVDSPWHDLPSHQRDEINDFLTVNYLHQPIPSNIRIFIINKVFQGWNCEVKPDVPVIHHPQLESFSFSFDCAKRTESENSLNQEIERPSKIRRTSGADAASENSNTQSRLQTACLTLRSSPRIEDPNTYTKSTHLELKTPASVAHALSGKNGDLLEPYIENNCDICVFLIRKYLYNADKLEPWSPEQDGKPGVSSSDIKKDETIIKHLNEFKKTMREAADFLKAYSEWR